MSGSSGSRAYRAGAAVAIVASSLTVWTTIVRDDGSGMSYFLLIMAAVVGAFSAWFDPAGMARTMFGVAIVQALLGVAVATTPSAAGMPAGSKALLFSGFFTALWLISAAFFRASSKRDCRPAAAGNRERSRPVHP
jgi:predicted membrane channel-forming protein YqfA (hemolysin III family)